MKDGYATSIKRVKQREGPMREGKVLGSPGAEGSGERVAKHGKCQTKTKGGQWRLQCTWLDRKQAARLSSTSPSCLRRVSVRTVKSHPQLSSPLIPNLASRALARSPSPPCPSRDTPQPLWREPAGLSGNKKSLRLQKAAL